MNYIGKFISNFKDFYNEINAATLTGKQVMFPLQYLYKPTSRDALKPNVCYSHVWGKRVSNIWGKYCWLILLHNWLVC